MTNIIDRFDGNYMFLSNFLYAPFSIETQFGTISVPTAEHAYQAAKTEDPEIRAMIYSAPSPGKSKRMGRMIILRDDWEDIKVDCMRHILTAKFSLPKLRELLLSTGDATLVEGTTWHDTFWGICTCPQHLGEGENNLGKLLEEIRQNLV